MTNIVTPKVSAVKQVNTTPDKIHALSDARLEHQACRTAFSLSFAQESGLWDKSRILHQKLDALDTERARRVAESEATQ